MRLRAAAASAALALAAVLAVAQPAAAHDQLAAADPEAGSTVSALDQVTLTFSETLLAQGESSANLADVTGPDGRHYETACATVADAVLTLPVALGAAGEYTVSWRVVSSDGHPVSDTYAFTYAPDEGADAAAGAAVSPCAAISGETASPEPSTAPTAAAPSEEPTEAPAATAAPTAAASDGVGTGLAIGLGAGALVIGALAVIVVVAVRRRPHTPPED